MYIKNITINGFGNLQNEEIELNKGINIIHGKNESGKSTLTNYIKCMFYGISKNKEGNRFSDFERFNPWNNASFGGKLTYEYEGEDYTILRDFNKNGSKIYDSFGNEITSEFTKDKTRGVEIGLAHLKVDEETFKNSTLIRQSKIEVENQEQRTIIQKLTNMIQLGEEGVSYDNIKNRLEKIMQDEVGTGRTQNKPINVVNREIIEYSSMKEKLIHNRKREYEIDEEIKKMNEKKIKSNKSYVEAKKAYEVKKKYEDLLEEKRNAYETAKKIMEREKAEYEKIKKKKVMYEVIGISVLFILLISVLIILKQYVYALSSLALAILCLYIYHEFEKEGERVFPEANFDITKEELNKKEQKELDDLLKEGVRSSIIERKTDTLKNLIEGYDKSKNEAVLEEHKLEIEKNCIKDNVVKLTEIEERLQEAMDKKEKIDALGRSIKLAIDTLEESYEDIKREIIPEITELIKESVSKTTNREYTDIMYNDANGLLAKDTNGDLITIDKLSIGTIDQIYLGFRLAIANKLENIPLILDEAFVYYDEQRLKNILQTLAIISKEKQIIILTCSDREINILKQNNINYNEINL